MVWFEKNNVILVSYPQFAYNGWDFRNAYPTVFAMKKLIPLLVLVLVIVCVWYFAGTSSPSSNTQTSSVNMSGTQLAPTPALPGGATEAMGGGTAAGVNPDETEDDFEDEEDADLRTATEIYKNSDEALAAVKNGSKDYDDIILSQFTTPGEDCTWCDQFYKGIKDLIASADTKPEQKSYFAEILAISGRVENVSSLVDLIKGAKNPEEAQLYAEALELTVGKDDVVHYLGDQLKNKDQTLRESSVAAITNQGSRLSAELLYKFTVENGDPDGLYSQGIGLGELVPSEDTLPYLQELVQKRDQYSHLAVKSLLNSGLPGLRLVMDTLTNSKDPESDRALLKDAIDHVNYEEDIEEYLKNIVESSKQPSVVEFAKNILNDFAAQDAEAAEDALEDPAEEEAEAPMSKMPE